MLKNSFWPRLLKKAKVQGGKPGTHPQDGCRREAYRVPIPMGAYVAVPRRVPMLMGAANAADWPF